MKIPGCPEIWVDHGNTHATKTSSFNSTYNFAIKVHKAVESANGALGTSNACFHQSTPALETMRKSKNSTYEPLIALADAMNKKGFRTETPTFFAAVMTHEGEFSGPLLQLIELMTMKGFKPYALRLKRELPDGDSAAFKTAKYRTNFKDALMCASTKGLGSMLLAAGKPPQTLSLAEARKAPPNEHWEENGGSIDPYELSQRIRSNMPSESARHTTTHAIRAQSVDMSNILPVHVNPPENTPTRPPIRRHTTTAELSMHLLSRTSSAPSAWPISDPSASNARRCNQDLGQRSISAPNSASSHV
jgi:hypothetical protein